MIKSIIISFSRLLCTLSSYSPVVVFYIISRLLTSQSGISSIRQIAIIVMLVLCCLVFALIARKIIEVISISDCASIKTIHPIENNAIPTYVGLFVISLGISGLAQLGAIFILFVLFIMWLRFERVCYFNPIWSLFRWYFYEFQTEDGTYFLITQRKDIKSGGRITNLRRINNYTFMEVK